MMYTVLEVGSVLSEAAEEWHRLWKQGVSRDVFWSLTGSSVKGLELMAAAKTNSLTSIQAWAG